MENLKIKSSREECSIDRLEIPSLKSAPVSCSSFNPLSYYVQHLGLKVSRSIKIISRIHSSNGVHPQPSNSGILVSSITTKLCCVLPQSSPAWGSFWWGNWVGWFAKTCRSLWWKAHFTLVSVPASMELLHEAPIILDDRNLRTSTLVMELLLP
jgi:hypothetical protein